MGKYSHDVFRLFAVPAGPCEARERGRIERLLFARVAANSLSHAISATSSSQYVCSDVYDTLAAWASTERDFWSRDMGHLWRATNLRSAELTIGAIVANGIHASASGIRGNWDFALPRPISFRLSDVVLSSVRAGHIESDQQRFCGVFECDSAKVSIECDKDGSKVSQSTEGEKPPIFAPSINIGERQYHLVPSLLASAELVAARVESEYDDTSVDIAGAGQLSMALCTLLDFSPGIYEWVSSVVREVTPLRSKMGYAGSASNLWDCGTIALTMTANLMSLIEMLVHEASHQHFFLAKQLGPLDNGSDSCRYFSPMVNAERPLEKMFLGYHALINMLSFYESVYGSADETNMRFVAKRTDHLFDKLDYISPVMSDSSALTPLGRAIFEALYEKEHDLRTYFSH